MASAATRGSGQAKRSGQQAPALPIIPFTHAAHEHVEPAFDVSRVVTANSQQLGPFDVPAFGYLRNIWILVEGSGGATGGGGATLSGDAPFNLIQDVALLDVNGAPIFGPYNGYQVYLANKWGGYQFLQDPDAQPNYSNTIATPTFALRIPVEISAKTGLGALSNMNASANYKVQVSLAASTTWLSVTTGATLPTVRVRGFLEAWTLPNPTSRDGLPQATMPPLHGTAQYWSIFTKVIASGENDIILPRVGNQIRNLIAVFYNDDTPSVRNSTEYPDPIRFNWDARQLLNEARPYRQQTMFERYGNVGLDTGVFVYDFAHDANGHPGGEDDGHLWLRTVQATRLEFVGNFGGAGTLQILTNDVAPVAVTNRFEEDSRSGGVPGAGEGFNG